MASKFGLTAALMGLLVAACGDDSGGEPDSTGSTSSDTTTSTSTSTSTSTTSTTGTSTSTTTTDGTGTGDGTGGSTGGQNGLPDIDMSIVQTQMEGSAYTELVDFAENSCALEEACIDAAGERRVLRFSTITPNVGGADFVVGNPDDNPERFEWGECHGHWHFKDFAAYRLLDMEGNIVANGHKQAFALIDFSPWSDDAGDEQYPLTDGTQGISVGWADIYAAGLDCQWVDITDVPNGDYVLVVSINASQGVEEADYDNNIVSLNVTIDDQNGPPPVPDEWTCDDTYWGTFDGCDCGCGAFDTDCMNPTADACEYCDNPGSCASTCADISQNNNAVCD
jgi:hypothetical protein